MGLETRLAVSMVEERRRVCHLIPFRAILQELRVVAGFYDLVWYNRV
jgi:hypothetical protein